MKTVPRKILPAVLATLLAAFSALSTHAVEQAPNPEPAGPVSPVAPATPGAATDAGIGVDQLLNQLPSVASVVKREDKVYWEDGKGASYRFAPVIFSDRPVLETDIGRLPVTRKLLEDNRVDAVAALPKLIAHAKEAGLQAADLLLAESIIAGYHLRSASALVLEEGVLKKSTAKPADRGEDKAKVAAAVQVLVKELPNTPLDELGRKTVEDVLKRMGNDEGNIDLDEVSPAFARRVSRFGWLGGVFSEKHKAQIESLQSAITEAERFQPADLFEGTSEGKPMRLAKVTNAFGYGGWILSTPARSAVMRPQPQPMYHSIPDMNVVIDLPPGSDPAATPKSPLGARLYQSHSGQLLATWKAGGAFIADKDEWRKNVPGRGKGATKNVVADFIPPNIVLVGLNGDILGIESEGGELLAPKNGSPEEAERFLTQAAQALPDPAHLDLVGEFLFTYVYDSPDSRFPYLIGNKRDKGDIHQTSVQTISTATGGMVRGDCDDLSELYQAIAERQGRTAHVISLPQHAALAWADKKEDSQWHVYILQTGPAMEFVDADLKHALEKAYKNFDESETFDPNGLGLLLRFSGENTRSAWRLSYRIFAEPEYARVMIDVQKDWHFQTYQRGISKMLKLIADGDQDNANYRELSGLYSYTGQYDLAAQYHRWAIERTPEAEPTSKLYMNVELIQHLIEAGKLDEARAQTLDVLDKQLPALKDKLGLSAVQLGVELATALNGHLDDLALRTVKDTMLKAMSSRIERISEWLESAEFSKEAWEQSGQFQQLRRLTQMFSAVGIATLKSAGQDALPNDPTLKELAKSVQLWLNTIAFRDIDEPDEAMMRYASAGQYYAAILGKESVTAKDGTVHQKDRFLALLEGAEIPKSGEHDHDKRIGGLAQLNLDLPWIRISVPFWFSRLTELFGKDKTALDPAEVAALGKHLEEAMDACKKLDIEHPQIESEYHLGRLITALVAQDPKIVRERLHFVVEKNDKRLRDDTAQWLGDTARFLPMDWYKQVIAIWKEEVNYKPKYFWIAWRAALNGGPKQALYVAEVAATEFKDDPAFTEEYEFMKKVLEPQLKAAK